MRAARRTWLAAALLASALACRAPRAVVGPSPDELRAVEATLEELYRAFCFDAGGEADWDAMRALFADGAVFVAPFAAGETPRAVGADAFLDDFRAWVASEAMRATGLHERIVIARIELFGSIAHAWITFEGFVPGEPAPRTLGLDSLQLVRDGGRWKLVSFTTQYAGEALPLSERFLGDRRD